MKKMQGKLFLVWAAVLTITGCAASHGPTLRELALARGIDIGAAVEPSHLGEGDYAQTLARYFTYITPENVLKREKIEPTLGNFTFQEGDALASWVKDHGFVMRGHTLLWHNQNPSYVNQLEGKPEEAKKYLRDYIFKIMGHYKGVIRDWDVVNEAFDEQGNLRTESPWYKSIGPDYIDWAFKTAHEADPQAKLFINDYSTETVGVKSDALYKYVKEARERGIPIDGVGFQFHVDDSFPFDFPGAARNMKRFSALGVQIQFTEIDMRLAGPIDQASRDKQTKFYGKLMRLALSTPGFKSFITWGISDKYSWIPGFFKGYDEGLLFDKNYQPKSAYEAVVAAFQDPDLGPGYLDKLIGIKTEEAPGTPPFRAVKAASVPAIDGQVSPGEWEGAYAYPFPFNQLDPRNQNGLTDPGEFSADWQLLYQGNTVYGLVHRKKTGRTVTTMKNSYENDNLEVFFSMGSEWHQYRSVAGAGWEDPSVKGKIVWSKDKSVAEFSLELPVDNLAGKTIAWNIAVSDNDGRVRTRQVYPVAGSNVGWQGREFGALAFADSQGSFPPPQKAGTAPGFKAGHLAAVPNLTGAPDRKAWALSPVYPLGFNQKGGRNQVLAGPGVPSVQWSIGWLEGRLYGLVWVSSPTARSQESLQINFKTPGGVDAHTVSRAENYHQGSLTLNWNPEGTLAQWSWQPSPGSGFTPGADQKVAFSLAFSGPVSALYPIPGYAFVKDSGALNEQMTRAGQGWAELDLE